MRISGLILATSLVSWGVASPAQELLNPGFEMGWTGWTDVDPNKDATAISGHFKTGIKSAKITKETGRFEQKVKVIGGSDYELQAAINGPGVVGLEIDGATFSESSAGSGSEWVDVKIPFRAETDAEITVFGGPNGGEGRFDDFVLVAKSGPALEAAEARTTGPRVFKTIPGGCDRMSQLAIKSASDDGTSEDTHPAELAVDHDFDAESRWSSKSAGKELILDLSMPHTVKEIGIAWYKGHARKSLFEASASVDGKTYATLIERRETGGMTTAIERYDLDDMVARYVKITGHGNFENAWNSIVEVQVYGCGLREIDSTGDGSETAEVSGISPLGLQTAVAPAENFDLSDWKITIPKDLDGNGSADEIKELELAGGWMDRDVFYTDPVSGGMVFRSSTGSTTPNSSYPRSELREMLRAGDNAIETRIDDGTPNKNNWVFSSAPKGAQALAGGVDGILRGTLSVDQVTRIGDSAKVGRVVIGQIHGKDDEPIRLYYRKLPFNTHGSIYYAHEIAGGDDVWVELIGGRSAQLDNPEDGILLGETFSYEITVKGQEKDGVVHPMLNVSITRADGSVVKAPPFDMIDSGYSSANDFMYFKAGAYSQNNTTTWPERDFDQVTFYALENIHDPAPTN